MNRKFVIVLHGPTGVGKTACADYIATLLPVEIVNADMGQLYEPLTIGTAKPDWRASVIPHHLFDILTKPTFFSVYAYREQLKNVLQEIWNRQKIPLIIGGSSFYVASLFFLLSPTPSSGLNERAFINMSGESSGKPSQKANKDVWQQLYEIDPERAEQIDPADRYRIERALAIWQSTGVKPSAYAPVYDPIAPYLFLWITRDREELYRRINERVVAMMKAGWVAEVAALRGTEWELFVHQKKIIGYTEILAYLEGRILYDEVVRVIQQRTRRYAKRQISFWNMLKKRLESALKNVDVAAQNRCLLVTLNLTDCPIERYSEQLKQMVYTLLRTDYG